MQFSTEKPTMSSSATQLHFILFPLMAPGHMIPMIDIAKLLAERDVAVTIVTTPVNAQRFGKTINRATRTGLRIHLLEVHFPAQEAGLPEGCENLDSLPSLSMVGKFFVALSLFRQKVEQTLLNEAFRPDPTCLISDMGLPWTTQIAERLQIPRFVFHGTCCFSLLCSYNVVKSNICQSISSDTEYFAVPGLPDKIEITKAQIMGTANANSAAFKDVTDRIREAEEKSYGVVVNSFEEMEPDYVNEYRKARGKKVWCIGPVSLCNREISDKVDRGNKASIDQNLCLDWLDSRDPGSVIYASFGTLSRLPPLQMMELALGLEASNRPFIWAFGGNKSDELEKLISENGFEERVKDRALLIRGWAPQVIIVSHQAIGGFLTHCGWNSTLEGISAGVPMVSWPQFAEQFYNERLIVDVLKIGVSVGVKVPVKWGEEDKAGILVHRNDVQKALTALMEEGDEGDARRRRAGELGEKARKAVENGGSSYSNITLLLQEFIKQ